MSTLKHGFILANIMALPAYALYFERKRNRPIYGYFVHDKKYLVCVEIPNIMYTNQWYSRYFKTNSQLCTYFAYKGVVYIISTFSFNSTVDNLNSDDLHNLKNITYFPTATGAILHHNYGDNSPCFDIKTGKLMGGSIIKTLLYDGSL